MAKRWENSGNSDRLYYYYFFLEEGSKIPAEVTAAMKLRHLLLGRKAMINLDSILKSRDKKINKYIKIKK